MAKTPDTPEEILRAAAQAAKEILPSAERDLHEAHQVLAAAQNRLAQLRAIANAPVGPTSRFAIQPRPTATSTTTSVSTSTGEVVTMHGNANLLVADKIEIVLKGAGKSLTTRDLSTGIDGKFGSQVPMSSIYAALAKGRESGRFIEEEGKWTVKK